MRSREQTRRDVPDRFIKVTKLSSETIALAPQIRGKVMFPPSVYGIFCNSENKQYLCAPAQESLMRTQESVIFRV